MRLDPSSLYLFIAIAFLAGIAVGWLLATVRVKGRINVSLEPPGSSTGTQGLVTTKTSKTRMMEIKCACGSLMKFRDPVEPGYQPYPTGDSVTCPNCGRSKDLTEIRKLAENVQA